MWKELANWRSQYLSLGGRVTLVNIVLDALPTYMMSLFPIPVNAVDILDVLYDKVDPSLSNLGSI